MKIDWDKEKILAEGYELEASSVIARLSDFVTEVRREKIDKVLSQRSAYFTPVLEGLYDRGNVSAVMRSAEAFGFFKFHIIETSDEFKESQRVTQGADKWLEVNKWASTKTCIDKLKADGYKVYATHLSKEAIPFDDLDLSRKTAVIFGNERDGCTDEALNEADGNVLLPMAGFTQSFNISVAGALSFQRAYLKKPKKVSVKEAELLRALYYLQTMDWPDEALKKWLTEA